MVAGRNAVVVVTIPVRWSMEKPAENPCIVDTSLYLMVTLWWLTVAWTHITNDPTVTFCTAQIATCTLNCTWRHYKVCTAVHGNQSQSYGASPAIWNHTVLPATRHARLNPSQTGRYSIYMSQRDGRLSWLGRLADALPVRRQSPIQVVTGPGVARLCWATH